MFTGIIKATGRIGAIAPKGGDLSIEVASDSLPWQDYAVGESIAVNGVCLTAVTLSDAGFVTDVSRETMDVTALGDLVVGSEVNLEPSLALGERLGGHLVSGHVDCVGKVIAQTEDARSIRLEIAIPSEYSRYVARKGSVCVDGVSLTINAVSDGRFGVNIIPHTAEVTIVSGYRTGTRVNIEVDQIMRYLERLLGGDASDDGSDGITRETLEAHGYG